MVKTERIERALRCGRKLADGSACERALVRFIPTTDGPPPMKMRRTAQPQADAKTIPAELTWLWAPEGWILPCRRKCGARWKLRTTRLQELTASGEDVYLADALASPAR